MSLAIKALFEPLRSTSAAAITGAGGAYIGVGTALNFPTRQFFIQNYTDQILMFSFDGINDHFPLAPNQFYLNDLTSNKTVETGYFIAKDTRLYVKYLGTSNPTMNSVYFSVLYGIDY
jgi:hypothetical protein